MKRIRIVGGKQVSDTRVFDADTGEEITLRVRKVTWVHEAGKLPVATIELAHVAEDGSGSYVEFEGEAEVANGR